MFACCRKKKLEGKKNTTKIQSFVSVIYCPVALWSCDGGKVKGEGGLLASGGQRERARVCGWVWVCVGV